MSPHTSLKMMIAPLCLITDLRPVRACWERNLDMSSDEVLRKVISEASFDANSILERANSDEFKKALRARTQEAKEIGLCGVPSYRVFRRRAEQSWKVCNIVWGQDESNVVEDLIVGWDDTVGAEPSSGASGRSRL